MSVPENIKVEAEMLRAEIEEHIHRYHVLDSPTISDAEYDVPFSKLQELDNQNPENQTSDLPPYTAKLSYLGPTLNLMKKAS